MKIFFAVLLVLVPNQTSGMGVPWYFHTKYFVVEPVFELNPDQKEERRRPKPRQPLTSFAQPAGKRQTAAW